MITSKRILNVDDPLWERIGSTYELSFPPAERRDFELLPALLAHPYFRAYALLSEGAYAGMITCWEFPGFTYVEHFAIDEAARNGGIGGQAMRSFLQERSAPVVLEVEPPTCEISRRRIGFYERLGFVLDDRPYRQPPYRKGEAWIPLQLMSYGPTRLAENYETVRDTIYEYVYGIDANWP